MKWWALMIALFQVYYVLCNDPKTIFFSNLNTQDGLPSNIISAITQDESGFIWVGTGRGLARYDGYHFQVFKKSASENSLPSNELNVLLSDGDYIWVGTWSGLCKIHIRTFEITRIDLGENGGIRALCKGTNGEIWVGTGQGLIQYWPQENRFEKLDHENSGLSHNTVRSIYQDSGSLWVGTFDGLNRMDLARFGKFERIALPAPRHLSNHLILDIKPAGSDSLWIGTEAGLYQLHAHTKSAERITSAGKPFSNDVVKCIYAHENGRLWLGTDFGLNIFTPASGQNAIYFHNPQIPYSIGNNVIWQIYEDRSGVIWLVTSNGLSKINKWESYYDFHEVSFTVGDQQIGNQVKTILQSSDGCYWLGTERGVICMDPATGSKKIFERNSSANEQLLLNNVFALTEDQSGNIWIGTAAGINIWHPQTKQMESITASAENGLTSNYIARFAKAPDGTMWVSAWEGGVYRVSGSSEARKFAKVPDIEGSEKMVFGAGYLWCIAYDELYRIDPKTLEKNPVKSFNTASGDQMIHSLSVSQDQTLWASTNNGLIAYDPAHNTATYHKMYSGTELTFNSIAEDTQGHIWSATNVSIVRFDRSTEKFEIYPLDHDLPIRSFYYGCSANAGPDKILFGGDNGFITFYPEKQRPVTQTPYIYITSITVNNQQLTAGSIGEGSPLTQDAAFTQELVLDYSQRAITLAFSNLSYWQPALNVYAYRLKGLDDEWQYVTGLQNFAVYSSLPSGRYTFEVKAISHEDGVASAVATLNIQVKPPVYLSNSFLLAYFVMSVIGVYYALRFYSNRIELNNELKIARMEAAHAEELEKTKERFFTNISHELRTPISLILAPIQELQKAQSLEAENKELITLAEKNAMRLHKLVNQILDFNKLENERLPLHHRYIQSDQFCRQVFQLFADQARRHHIHFSLQTDGANPAVWIDEDKMEIVLFNLLSNAFKFTPDHGAISVRTFISAPGDQFPFGSLQIAVSDTGIGISKEDAAHIFQRFYQTHSGKAKGSGSGIGLTIASEYVQLHGGQLTVQSEEGAGSTFTIQLPLGEVPFTANPAEDATLLETDMAANISESDSSQTADTSLPTILVVEDNEDISRFIVNRLQRKYHFLTAINGEAGLTLARKELPDVIISDIMMPVMDGLELCSHVKQSADTSHIMVILLTAKSLNAQRLEGVRRGADVYLTKPFEIDLLDAHIANLLRRKTELTDYFRKELITVQDESEEKDNQDNKFIKKVMDIIEANVSEPEFTVEELSDEIGMSTTHLYRKLKSLTNHSAQDLIKKYRLKKASLYLQNNEGNITEAMYQVGFNSASYFSKCFKEEFGMTPKEYQRQHSSGISQSPT